MLYALYRDAGQPHDILARHRITLEGVESRASLIPKFIALEVATKQALLKDLMAHLVRDKKDDVNATPGQGELVKAAIASVQVVNLNLAQAFTPTEDFWQAHTRAGIESLLRDAKSPEGRTFTNWYIRQNAESDTNQSAFARLLKNKMADVITTLGKCTFDWSAWLPVVITKRLQNKNTDPS
ncbi:MAG: hypothetical protein KDJ99_14350 [Candidatus Competibacteraceae bacterium]|nr:hypothetical protein [Candidatus Competibacteraceae bacterium]